MKRYLMAIIVSALVLPACFGSPAIRVGPETKITLTPDLDRPGFVFGYGATKAILFADRIEIRIHQVPGYNVGNLYASVHNEDIYLSPLYISSGGDAIQTFRFAYPPGFSLQKPPRQIYWITAATFPWPWQGEASAIQAYPIPLGSE